MNLDEKFQIPIKCPKCGEVTDKGILSLERDNFRACGFRITPSGAADPVEAARRVAAAVEALKKLWA